jgi:ABC-type glycerol-3-phosphate transport system substrate-binding protein
MTRNHYRAGFLVTLLLLAAILILVQGCGGGGNAGDTPGADGKTVITFWHFQSEPGQKKALADRIKAFEAENPTVTVEMQDLNWNDGKSKLLAAFNSNTAPDVIELGSDWVAQFSSAGVLADQSALGGDDIARFASEVSAPGKWEKGIYAWPWTTDTRVLFYNKALLASAGVDTTRADTLWDDVLAHSEKVRAANHEVYGFGANGSDPHRLYKKILPFFWSNGGDVLNAQGAPAINSPENVAALDMYLTLARVGFVDSQKGLDQLFVSGKLAYWISGPWLVDRIAKDSPGLRYGVAVLPSFAGKKSVSFAGGEYLAINNESKRKAEAKKLIVFLTSPKEALEFAKALPGGTTPADMSVANDPFLQSAGRKVFTEQLHSAKMTPVHPKWLEIEGIIEEEVSAALLGNKTAQQALDAANTRVAQLNSGAVAQVSDTAN